MDAPVYVERPAARPGWIVWTRSAPADPTTHRVLPDGCIDVLWTRTGNADGELIVAGPDTTAQLSRTRGGQSYLGVRFAPGLGPAVLGVAADELRDRHVPLVDIWGARRTRELAELITDRPDLVDELVARAARTTKVPALPAAVAANLARGLSVATTAGRAGFSERQLRRRSLEAYGYGPKLLARILRLGHALDLARAGVGYASVAQRTGYADQAHFARDVRELAGVPLGELLAS